MGNSFGSRGTLSVGGSSYTIYRLSAVEQKFPQAAKLPFSLKILLLQPTSLDFGNPLRISMPLKK
jgi:aconitase A